jgi:hypothetical protein
MTELRDVSFIFPVPGPDSASTQTGTISIDSSCTFIDLRRKIARQQQISWTFRIREADHYPEDTSNVLTPERTFDEPFFLESYPFASGNLGRMKLCFQDNYFVIDVYLNETIADVTRILQTTYGLGDRELLIVPPGESVACYDNEIIWNLSLLKFYDVSILEAHRSTEPPKLPEKPDPPPVSRQVRSRGRRSGIRRK